jgi:methionine sulfoxide reductase heme-binding subunit
LKPLVFAAALVPFVHLVWRGLNGNLTADPLVEVTNETGIWTLRFIVITLAITPLRRLTGWNPVIRFRRMLGLFAFFYGTLHFLTYVVGDRFASLDFPDGFVAVSTLLNLLASIWEDVAKRPYITVGFIAFMAMVPLAFTSTAGWIRRLGGRNWQRLHRLIYVTAIAGVTHYWWKVKADTLHPGIYAAIVAVLLAIRVMHSFSRSRARRPVQVRA